MQENTFRPPMNYRKSQFLTPTLMPCSQQPEICGVLISGRCEMRLQV